LADRPRQAPNALHDANLRRPTVIGSRREYVLMQCTKIGSQKRQTKPTQNDLGLQAKDSNYWSKFQNLLTKLIEQINKLTKKT